MFLWLLFASQILQSLVGTESGDLCREIVHRSGKLCTLSGRYPLNAGTLTLNAEVIEHREEHGHTAAGIIVTRGIMAVTGMASAEDNSIRSALECTKDEHGVYSAGARNADDLYVCRISKTVASRKVRTCV